MEIKEIKTADAASMNVFDIVKYDEITHRVLKLNIQ